MIYHFQLKVISAIHKSHRRLGLFCHGYDYDNCILVDACDFGLVLCNVAMM